MGLDKETVVEAIAEIIASGPHALDAPDVLGRDLIESGYTDHEIGVVLGSIANLVGHSSQAKISAHVYSLLYNITSARDLFRDGIFEAACLMYPIRLYVPEHLQTAA